MNIDINTAYCSKCENEINSDSVVDVSEDLDYDGCWLCFRCASEEYQENIKWNNQWIVKEEQEEKEK